MERRPRARCRGPGRGATGVRGSHPPQPSSPSGAGTWGGGRRKLQCGHSHTRVYQVHVGRPRRSGHLHGAAGRGRQQLQRPHGLRQRHHLRGGHHLGQAQQGRGGAQARGVPSRRGHWHHLRGGRGGHSSRGQREGGGGRGARDYLGQGPRDFLPGGPGNSPLSPLGLGSLGRSLLQPNLSGLRVQDQGSPGVAGSLGAGLRCRRAAAPCEQQGPQAGGVPEGQAVDDDWAAVEEHGRGAAGGQEAPVH